MNTIISFKETALVNSKEGEIFAPISPTPSIDGRISAIGREELFRPLSVCASYTPERQSIELKLSSPRFVSPLALYKSSPNVLTKEARSEIEEGSGHEKLYYAAKFFHENTDYIPCLVFYFTPEELEKFELKRGQSLDDYFSKFDSDYLDKIDKGNIDYLTHCIVIQDEKIFIHPKTDAQFEKIFSLPVEYRTNHASLSNGKDVTFAGTLIKTKNQWEISNLSGHYKTPASKLETCFFVLKEKEIPLNNVYFAEYTVENKEITKKETISIESMNERLNSTIRSLSSLTI